jgi:LuxR family transcriptional regulator, quorum-sensing system regulator CciR
MDGPFDIARAFAEQARQSATTAELVLGLEGATLELGFRHFAMLHHVDLREPRETMIHIDNYPQGWAEHFIEARLYLDDPILRASLATNVGFCWTDVANLIRMGPQQRRILEAARRAGLENGFTVPSHIPGEAHGSCSFASPVGRTISTECQLAAQLVGSFAFQAVRRICCARFPLSFQAVQLSPRQRECLELVAQGKTDWEIGAILGLKKDSVTKVVDAARRRYEVANRTQLIVAALFDGQISFNEICHWWYRLGFISNRS